jgi:signal transduction histidine kinase
MTPLMVAQLLTTTIGVGLAVVVAAGIERGRVPAVTGAGLVLLVLVQSAAQVVPLDDWQIRDPWVIAFAMVLGTYPDGQFVPPWTKWLVSGAITAALVDAASQGASLDGLSPFVLPPLVIVLLGCQAHRYRRRATVDERTRVRWPVLTTGWAVVGLTSLPLFTGVEVGVGSGWPAALATVLVLLIPLGLVIGLVRPQLADVDRLLHASVEVLALGAASGAAYALAYLAAAGVGSEAPHILAAPAAVVTALLVRPSATRLADGFVGIVAPDPVGALTALGERFERSLDGHELAASVARTTADALLLPDVEVSVSGAATASVGTPAHDSESFEVTHLGEPVGVIRAAPRPGEATLTERDRALLRLIASHAGAAMHAVRVVAELSQARERLVLAREEERRRLRRDLHDDLAPQLAGLALSGAAVREFVMSDAARARELAGELADDARRAAQQVREIAYDLRPPVLDDLGLSAAIVDRVARPPAPDGLEVTIDAPAERLDLPAAVELAALRIVQEAVTNTRKHGDASRCRVVLRRDGQRLVVEISDDGCGVPSTARKGVGLRSMVERANELGGSCDISSSAAGTQVLVRLPLSAGRPS